jgi:MOSC domain-containing protein YiiM
MTTGTVHAMYIRPARSASVREQPACQAWAGYGLEGDYAATAARESTSPVPPRKQLTLIEAEAYDALKAMPGMALQPGESRRNITTTGVSLNDLVGREFTIGSVRARGIELCHPCAHLEAMTSGGMVKALTDRGGLRAEILTDGVIHQGDAIVITAAAHATP